MNPGRLRRATGIALLAALGSTGGAAQAFADRAPAVRWAAPAAPALAWRGIVSLDGGASGSSASMMYPAPNLAGFLAAILTHAALASSAQSAEQKRQQDLADAVLAPYAAALQEWPAQALWKAALADTRTPQARPEAEQAWTGEAVPSFSLAPDAGTLVLDLGTKLTPPGGATVEVVVRVVSMPLGVPDPRAYWVADDAKALKAAATALFSHGLGLAAREAVTRSSQAAAGTGTTAETTADATPFRTHRYFMGRTQRSERAQQLGQDCDRIVMRTLRGWLLSAPVALPAAPQASAAVTTPADPAASAAALAAVAAAASAAAPANAATTAAAATSAPASAPAATPARTTEAPAAATDAAPAQAPPPGPACDPLYQV